MTGSVIAGEAGTAWRSWTMMEAASAATTSPPLAVNWIGRQSAAEAGADASSMATVEANIRNGAMTTRRKPSPMILSPIVVRGRRRGPSQIGQRHQRQLLLEALARHAERAAERRFFEQALLAKERDEHEGHEPGPPLRLVGLASRQRADEARDQGIERPAARNRARGNGLGRRARKQ